MDQILYKLNGSAILNYHGRVLEILCRRNNESHAPSIFQGIPRDSSFTILLLDMSVVLILSQIMRFLLKPLKQPKVISDVLAGIILGPSVLGHNVYFAKNVIPENSRFLIQNIGIIGFMFFLFVTGVKMDLTVILKQAGKKHFVIALAGVVIPHILVWIVVIWFRDNMGPELMKYDNIGGLISVFVITTFPVTSAILKDMQLLSSEIGRVALTTVIISDAVGLFEFVTFEAIKHGEHRVMDAVYYFLTVIGLSGLVINCTPKVMQWIDKQTPIGMPVDKKYVTATFLGVFVIGFFTDFIGAAVGDGPLWLGLAIPNGPPIGSTIVHKSEVLMNDILMPFAYANIGLKTNVFAISECWSCLTPLFALITLCFVLKLISVVMAARFTDMSYRDSLVMGFMLSLRGQTEFLLLLHWVDLKIIKTSSFSLMVILIIIMTSICTPIINFIYDPTRPYLINKRRTIQHKAPEFGVRILTCIYDQESMANLFSLLDFSNPTTSNPFNIFALYLVELVGRAAPIIIDNTKQCDAYWDNNNETIHKVIKLYEKVRANCLTINLFTSVTPQQTMYQDICEMALLNKADFIILPFHEKCIEDGTKNSTPIVRAGIQLANTNTLSHAPCSVGILICKNYDVWGKFPTRASQHIHRQFAMLFLGGPDAREALTLAGRMAEHPDVSLMVVRFLLSDFQGVNESERKLDDAIIAWFWMIHKWNEKVVYKEVVVNNGFETISIIHSLNNSFPIDLWIVGRKNGINPTLMEVLSRWSDNPELGLVGDFLVSKDFNSSGSVLVVQQQVLKNQHAVSWANY